MSLSLAVVAGAAVISWGASLSRPGWTRRAAAATRRRWRRWLIPALGLAVVALADPLLRQSPSGLLALLHYLVVAPALLPRLTLAVLLVLPVVADAAPALGGARALIGSPGRALRTALTWSALPTLAAMTVAHAFADVWSRVLGGDLAPAAHAIASVLVGAEASPGARSIPDPAFASAVNAMALAAVAVFLGQYALERRAQSGALPRTASSIAHWLASPLAAGLLLGAILLIGFNLRWQFLVTSNVAVTGLSADGQSYLGEAIALDALAQQRGINLAALFFSGSTWFREPLFIYLLHGWLAALGPQDVHAMYFTIVASLLWTTVAVAAVWALLGRWPALLTGLLLAIDDVWIRNAVIGLREEVAGLLLVSAAALLFSTWARARHLRWLAAGLVAAAALTRLDALPFGLFLLAWAAVVQRWQWRRVAMMAVLCGAVLAPTFAGYAGSRGTVAPAATVIATNNWIDEFRDRLGEPGFEPDRKVTAFEYLFRYHTPWQVTWYTARGAAIIYGQFMFDSVYYRLANLSLAVGGAGRVLGLEWRPLAPLIFAAGCGLLLVTQRRRWRTHWLPVALCVVGVLPPIGFSAGVPGHLMYQSRYGYLVAPFASAILAWTICAPLAIVYQRRLRRRAGTAYHGSSAVARGLVPRSGRPTEGLGAANAPEPADAPEYARAV